MTVNKRKSIIRKAAKPKKPKVPKKIDKVLKLDDKLVNLVLGEGYAELNFYGPEGGIPINAYSDFPADKFCKKEITALKELGTFVDQMVDHMEKYNGV